MGIAAEAPDAQPLGTSAANTAMLLRMEPITGRRHEGL